MKRFVVGERGVGEVAFIGPADLCMQGAFCEAARQQAVERFVVGERGVGEVAFIGPVDVLGLDLDSIVHFSRGHVQVYGATQRQRLPPPGEGLNMPALLTFRREPLLSHPLAVALLGDVLTVLTGWHS